MDSMMDESSSFALYNDDGSDQIVVSSADVIRLILAHLTECGLHESCTFLRNESGVGMGASLYAPQFWYKHCENGDWGTVLESLSLLDLDKVSYIKQCNEDGYDVYSIIAFVHEMAILELAEAGQWELAYSTYRLVQNDLMEIMVDDTETNDASESNTEKNISSKRDNNSNKVSVARLLEQKLAALADLRVKNPDCEVPSNYYYNKSKYERRNWIGKLVEDFIPRQPKNRLVSLLQQAIKWQSYTGQSPRVKRLLADSTDPNEPEGGDIDQIHRKETKYKKRNKIIKEFDLVVGDVSVDLVAVSSTIDSSSAWMSKSSVPEIEPWSTIKFGKNVTAEVALFTPDGTSSSLITGSSDGLIEIWDSTKKYTSLRTSDLLYQKNDELIGHEGGIAVTALAISNDCQLLASGDSRGHVYVWRFTTGKLLRKIIAHEDKTILDLSFPPDGSRVLTASYDGICREFGLRTSYMLKEFRGHTSFVNQCTYCIPVLEVGDDSALPLSVVITGSGDGTVRIWDAKTADVIRILQPTSIGPASSLTKVGDYISVADNPLGTSHGENSIPSVQCVLLLHTPSNAMVIVPRGCRAFLVQHNGHVVKTFHHGTTKGGENDQIFVAGTISSNNRWLYLVKEGGTCCIFDMISKNGDLVRTIDDFGEKVTSATAANDKKDAKMTKTSSRFDVTSIVHHPTKNIVAAFSNDKGQKKGQLHLWR